MAQIKKMCVLIVVGLFMGSSFSYAQEDVRKQLAEELLVLMEVDKNIEKNFEMIKQMQMDQIKNMKPAEELSREDSEKISLMQGKVMDAIAKGLGWDNLKGDYIAIYADVFAKEELEGLITFYKTPVGQKLIKKQPELMQKRFEVSQKQMATIMPKIQEVMEDMKESIKASKGKSQE